MNQRAQEERGRIVCAACSAPLLGIWAPPIDRDYLGDLLVEDLPTRRPDMRGWNLDGDTFKISRHALTRVRQGKAPAYRRSVPPQIPVTLPKRIECWRCGTVQHLDNNTLGRA
jgi:hypothetical protein